MARPRHIVPGTVYFLTRRCAQRAFRLRPSDLSSQIFGYALAVAAERTGVAVHAVCVMSNHHHAVVTDIEGRLPEFLAELHRTTAKALNAAQGEWENLWSAEHAHAAIIADDDALIDRIAYTATNPVAAGLVAQPEEWPGVSFWTPTERTVERPTVYFDPRGRYPDVARLRIVAPALSTTSDDAFATRVARRIRERVLAAHAKWRRAGRVFLGRAAVMAKSFLKRALSFESKREPVASVAASHAGTLRRELNMLRLFRDAYREARAQWRAGSHDIAFPVGTWLLRREHGAMIALSSE